MSVSTAEQHQQREPNNFSQITMGIVEQVEDTLEQLRIKVRCPSLGDYNDKPVDSLPWCHLASPFIGESLMRDNASGYIEGSSSYGLVLPPRVGATAIVACIDNDIDFRLCLGFIQIDFSLRTFPNGRYDITSSTIQGPLSNDDTPVSYQSSMYDIAFGPTSITNHEKLSRSIDRPISMLRDAEFEDELFNSVTHDEEITMDNGYKFKLNPGYQNDPNLPGAGTKAPTVYGLTTPMGNIFYMDDAVDNTRIKLRTPKGAQILLDDTNERIYINSAEGNSWLEMDYDGNIDGFCYNLNLHATNNINLTADNNFNVTAKNTNIFTKQTLSMTQQHLIQYTTENNVVKSANTNIIVTNDYIFNCGTMFISGNNYKAKFGDIGLDGNFSLNSTDAKLTASNMNITGSSAVLVTGGAIHLNGPGAAMASPIGDMQATEATVANLTSRRPDHEPWPRMSFSDTDTDHTVYKFSLTDPNIGTENIENLIARTRNAYWRR